MPQVVRGSSDLRRITSNPNSLPPLQTQSESQLQNSAASPTSPRPRVTFEQNRIETSNSLPASDSHVVSPNRRSFTTPRRHSSHFSRRSRDLPLEERDVYYDSRAATQREYRRRGSTLQEYYLEHPELLPQLPFTFRHGFKRWKLAGYIALMIFDACVVPIMLYYALTFGGSVQGYITFAVITAIWGGPTYMEFAVRSWRLSPFKKEYFFKPLGANQRWAFDITNWILVLTIASVTSLLIIGAAPHIVFLRVLSMPAPTILYCLSGPVFLLSLYSTRGWKAPFRISSTAKGEKVLPGIYYICEDVMAVNAGGGRPFREGWAARYNASPIFRKMIRDLSWFWSIPGLFVATACTVVVCIHPVPSAVAYGVGWAAPFIWAAIWSAITLPWVKSLMRHERKSWEEDSSIMDDIKKESAPHADAPGPLAEKPSEETMTTGGDQQENITAKEQEEQQNAKPEPGEAPERPPEVAT